MSTFLFPVTKGFACLYWRLCRTVCRWWRLGVAAVPETLGDSGVVVKEMRPDKIAEVIGLLVENDELRNKIIEGQQRRLDHFDQDKAIDKFRQTLELAFERK